MSRGIQLGRPVRILRTLYERSTFMATYSVNMKQSQLSAELGITRQALNVHLRKLRDEHYIRTGRGFIDITEKGLKALGIATDPTFLFIKISPQKRAEAYKKVEGLKVRQLYRVAGDMDLVAVVGREELDATLRQIAQIEGVEDTHSYISIESLK